MTARRSLSYTLSTSVIGTLYVIDRASNFSMLTYWQGLLNKERRILDTLGKDKPGKFRYKLYTKEQHGSVEPADLVTSDNWLEVLHLDTNPEQLDLWMERESLTIEITPDSDDESLKHQSNRAGLGSPRSALQVPPNPKDPLLPVGRPLAQTTSSTLLMVPKHRRNVSGSSLNSSTVSHATTRELTNFTPFLQWPFDDTPTKAGGRNQYGRLKLWLDTILARVARTRYNEMDTELQALCTGAITAPYKPTSTNQNAAPPAVSRSSRAQAHDRLRLAVPKASTPRPDRGARVSQETSLQKLRNLVDDVRSTTSNANINEVAFAQAFKAVQQYYDLPQQDATAKAVMDTLFLHMQIISIDLQGMTRDEVEAQFQASTGQQKTVPRSELEAVFSKGRHILALFVPEEVQPTATGDDWETSKHPLVQLYWGLQDRLIEV